MLTCLRNGGNPPLSLKNCVGIILQKPSKSLMQNNTLKKPVQVIKKTFTKSMQFLLIIDTGRTPDLSEL